MCARPIVGIPQYPTRIIQMADRFRYQRWRNPFQDSTKGYETLVLIVRHVPFLLRLVCIYLHPDQFTYLKTSPQHLLFQETRFSNARHEEETLAFRTAS